MKTVANCATLQEAQFLQLILRSRGIEAYLPDEMTAGVAPHLVFATKSGVRVQVGDLAEEEAKAVIEESRQNQNQNQNQDEGEGPDDPNPDDQTRP